MEISQEDIESQDKKKEDSNFRAASGVNALALAVFSLVIFGIGVGAGVAIGYGAFHKQQETEVRTITPAAELSSDTIVTTFGDRDAMVDCLNSALTDGSESVVLPYSDLYYNASQVFSKFYQNFPVAVVYAANENTISNVMKCATTYDIRVNPRCGGHGNAGQSVQTGEITLDISLMREVVLSDDFETVTVQTGNTAGSATYYIWDQSGGTRAIPIGQKPTVGISGLSLGGGFGFSTRAQGFLCDKMISLRAVTTYGDIITANATHNEDLFWASCGGGGGSFAVITQIEYETFDVSQNVTAFHYYMSTENHTEAAIKLIEYQEFSYALDPLATANLELENNSYMSITGYFFGNESEFYTILAEADPDNYFPAEGWSLRYLNYVDAALMLSGWPDTTSPSDLLGHYENHRNYFQFKSYFLFDTIGMDSLLPMLDFQDQTATTGLIFEFQSLGGVGSKFAEVNTTATAFSHRNARHCLMLKSWGETRTEGDYTFGVMSNFNYILANTLPGGTGAYVNHMDYELWDYQVAYYGVQNTSRGAIDVPWNYTIARLIEVNSEYDAHNLMDGLQLF